MKFKYRNFTITIQEDGLFHCDVNGTPVYTSTLIDAEHRIDTIMDSYYTMTLEDYNKVLAKLNSKEQAWVKDLVEALSYHYNSNYCELGDTAIFNNRRLYQFFLMKNK